MIKVSFKKLIFSAFTIGFFCNVTFGNSNFIFANQQTIFKSDDKEKAIDENETIDIKSDYILGPLDVLRINFRGLDNFSNLYEVNRDGYISLPELGFIKAEGNTIVELRKILLKNYQNFIYDPDINIFISIYKPIKVVIKGEVSRPGLYTFENSQPPRELYSDNDILDSTTSPYVNSSIGSLLEIPKLFDIFKESKGITNNADLTNVKVIRNNSKSQGGGKIISKINLLDILEEGDLSKNIDLHDGDLIIVPRTNSPILSQIIKANKSNLTPDEIAVYINGNVKISGKIIVPQGSSLFEALAIAGGNLPLTGNVEFIRFNENGRTEKKVFSYKPSRRKDSNKNPLLMQGDIIIVRTNFLGKSTSILREVGTPIINAVGIYSIFN